ncbi:MAG: GDSL-type esterase/lipase family protein [Ginsengibacter sp.]
MKRFLGYTGAFIFLVTLSCIFRQKKKNILFFGDSITKRGLQPGGYITKLRQMLDSDNSITGYELSAAGVDGNKVNDLFVRIDNDVLAKNPSIVVLWVGVNDVWHKLSGAGTAAGDFEKTYSAILKRLQSQGVEVLLATPPVIGEKKNNANMQDDDLNLYSKIIRKLSDQYNCKLVDIRKAFVEYDNDNNPENKNSGILTIDGVHLSNKGNALVAEKMMEVLAPILKTTLSN